MTLSPNQREILECLKIGKSRALPENAQFRGIGEWFWARPHSWSWSWEILQFAKTADYRRRIHELRKKGYVIEPFHVGKRHGYLLVAEPQEKEKAA